MKVKLIMFLIMPKNSIFPNKKGCDLIMKLLRYILCIVLSLMFCITSHADEIAHLSDEQMLEIFDDLEPDLLKNVGDDYVTRAEVVNILYDIYYKDADLFIMPLTYCPYKDVKDEVLYSKIRSLNSINPSPMIGLNSTKTFEPERNCKLAELIKMSFCLGNFEQYLYGKEKYGNMEIYPDRYMFYSEQIGLIDENEDSNRFITKDDVKNILSKLMFERIYKVSNRYSFVPKCSIDCKLITAMYGIKILIGKLNKVSGDTIKVGDTEIIGSVDKSFYMKNCTALYRINGDEKMLYKVFIE